MGLEWGLVMPATMTPEEARSLISTNLNGKTFHIQIRIRNNRLRSHRLALGLTLAQLARSSGVSDSLICALENLKKPPKTKSGDWRDSVTRLSEFFGVLPEDLFPEELNQVKVSSAEGEFGLEDLPQFCGMDEALSLPAPGDLESDAQAQDILAMAEDALSPRDFYVLRAVTMDGELLRDVGERLGLTTERIRQIHARAIDRVRTRLNQENRRLGVL